MYEKMTQLLYFEYFDSGMFVLWSSAFWDQRVSDIMNRGRERSLPLLLSASNWRRWYDLTCSTTCSERGGYEEGV